jgi:hypothetical protein
MVYVALGEAEALQEKDTGSVIPVALFVGAIKDTEAETPDTTFNVTFAF